MKTCEKCGKEHDGSYASGRFCSVKCANARKHSKETKEKISNSLKQEKKIYEKKCERCQVAFKTPSKRRRFCSSYCGYYECSRKPKPGNGGPREGGGKSKLFEYISPIAGSMRLNNDEIRLAKIFDNLKLNWKRNLSKGFPYIDKKQEKRKFYPDFYLPDYNLYIEYKGWLNKEMEHKMDNAKINNDLNLLIVYGNDRRYRDLGLYLSQLEQDNKLLINHITFKE